MEFTQELLALQGAFISLDNVHSFTRISVKGGNEEKILDITNTINPLIERLLAGCDKNDRVIKLRKLSFYMVLNADFAFLNELLECEEIDSVIWTIPTIPKCLLCEIFWNLNLYNYIYENIAYCAPKLSLQIADAFITSIKYSSPQDSLQKVSIICSAIYYQMCRLHLLLLDKLDLNDILMANFTNFAKCLDYFLNPPNYGKLEGLHRDQKYKHVGKCLATFFQLIQECLILFTQNNLHPPEDHIYNLTQKKDDFIEKLDLEFTINNSPNKSILEHIDKCNILLLDKCEVLVKEISVDIYCAWSEFEEEGKNMQQSIGELCFNMRTILQNINVLSEHPVVSMVREIAREPKQISDLVNETDSDTILKHIEGDGADKIKWLQAMLNKNDILENTILLNQIIKNIDMVTESESYNLLSRLYEHHKSNLDIRPDIKKSILVLFKKCSLDSKFEIMKQHFADETFSNTLETLDFNDSTTEIFNKLVSVPEADFTDVLSLFIQNPYQIYNKIFDVAVENIYQNNIMIKVITLIDNFKNYFYNNDLESCLIRIIQEKFETLVDTEAKLNNLLLFISELKNMNTIPGTKLLMLIIMPKLHKALVDNNIHGVYSQCRLLQDSFNTEELLSYRAPLLAMLAQVLDALRWRIDTFKTIMPSSLQLAINLQKSLFATYPDNIPEKESVWLKAKLKKTQPLNLYYYRKLWNPPGNTFVEVITGVTVHDKMDGEQLISWLSQILCSTTEQEWYEVWESLKCFGNTISLDIFHDTLCFISLAQRANQTEQSWACLLQCFKQFIFIVRFKYLKEPLTDEQLTTVLHRLRTLECVIKQGVDEDLYLVLLPLIVYIYERKEDYTLNVPDYYASISKNNKFSTVINKVFKNAA